MNNPAELVVPRVQAAIATAFGEEFRQTDPVVRPSQFADIQINAAMALAKKAGLPPRDAAARIVDALNLDGIDPPLNNGETDHPGLDILSGHHRVREQIACLAVPGRDRVRHLDQFAPVHLGREIGLEIAAELRLREDGRAVDIDGAQSERSLACSPVAGSLRGHSQRFRPGLMALLRRNGALDRARLRRRASNGRHRHDARRDDENQSHEACTEQNTPPNTATRMTRDHKLRQLTKCETFKRYGKSALTLIGYLPLASNRQTGTEALGSAEPCISWP